MNGDGSNLRLSGGQVLALASLVVTLTTGVVGSVVYVIQLETRLETFIGATERQEAACLRERDHVHEELLHLRQLLEQHLIEERQHGLSDNGGTKEVSHGT